MDSNRLKKTWIVLLGLTLVTALIAESADPAAWAVLLICFTAGLKGQLVIEHLMGLRTAKHGTRWLMRAYFYLLMPIIALGWLFPGLTERLTTL